MTLLGADDAHPALYAIVLVLHVISVAIGFGIIALSGVYARFGREIDRPGARSELERYFGTGRRVGFIIWAVPFLGAAALALDRGIGHLDRGWVFGALGCWAVAMVATLRVIWPAEGVIRTILAGAGGGAGESSGVAPAGGVGETASRPMVSGRAPLGEVCHRLELGAAVCDISFLVALVLMIFQPGNR